jgi:XFP N-terminal domain
LAHAYGAALDTPDLLVACVIGDGEAETGPLATAWHSNKFLNPVTDGAVLPILRLNGYKIANPTVLARIDRSELESLLTGSGHRPYVVEGDEPAPMHEAMAATLDAIVEEIRTIRPIIFAYQVVIRPRLRGAAVPWVPQSGRLRPSPRPVALARVPGGRGPLGSALAIAPTRGSLAPAFAEGWGCDPAVRQRPIGLGKERRRCRCATSWAYWLTLVPRR